MPQFLSVIVRSIADDHLVLELPDHTYLSWPLSRDEHQHGGLTLAEGTTLILTLTQQQQILQELLRDHP